jgi:tRNA pseudouridine55 synthase
MGHDARDIRGADDGPRPERMKPFGVLNLHKPSGVSSRRMVDRAQRLVRPAKAGHAGTLDPLASGVLVVCVGQATRLMEYVQRMRKSYTGRFLLGRQSDTEDIEGNVIELADPPIPSLADLQAAAARLTGAIQQRPPAFSALKVGGRRAYDLARAGQVVNLAPRPAHVYRMVVRDYSYPEFTLDIECGAGTYVRSLGRDLAIGLGTQAVMAGLVRTAIGRFTLADAIDPDLLTAENLPALLRSPLESVADLPSITLSDAEIIKIERGLPIDVPAERAGRPDVAGPMAAIDSTGRLVAILKLLPDGTLSAEKNFLLESRG